MNEIAAIPLVQTNKTKNKDNSNEIIRCKHTISIVRGRVLCIQIYIFTPTNIQLLLLSFISLQFVVAVAVAALVNFFFSI